MSVKDGGTAFPCEQHETQEGTWNQTFDPGMTLRDYFAAKAMQAALTGIAHRAEDFSYADLASMAYEIADAMLSAREKSND